MLETSLSYVIFHVPHDFGPERVECQLCHWLQYIPLHSCASPSTSLIWLKRKSSLKGQYLVVEIKLICIWMLKENMIFCSTVVTETVGWFHSFCKSTPPSSIVWSLQSCRTDLICLYLHTNSLHPSCSTSFLAVSRLLFHSCESLFICFCFSFPDAWSDPRHAHPYQSPLSLPSLSQGLFSEPRWKH